MVGDPHQQIYAFRGAINAMDMIQSTRTFYLTQVYSVICFCLLLFSTCLFNAYNTIQYNKDTCVVHSGQLLS